MLRIKALILLELRSFFFPRFLCATYSCMCIMFSSLFAFASVQSQFEPELRVDKNPFLIWVVSTRLVTQIYDTNPIENHLNTTMLKSTL